MTSNNYKCVITFYLIRLLMLPHYSKSERSIHMNEFLFRRDRDKRRDDEFNTFESFRNSLEFQCDEGDPGVLQVKGLYRRGIQGYSR